MNRRPDPGFDQRIADWLEADPEIAPPEVLATVVAALSSVPQRRSTPASWRSLTMSLSTRLTAAAVVAVVAIVAVIVLGRPATPDVGASPSPAVTPSAAATPVASPSEAVVAPTPPTVVIPEFDALFTSATHGFSISYPSTWSIQPAARPWVSTEGMLSYRSDQNDRLGDAAVLLRGNSQKIPSAWSDQDWLDWYASYFDDQLWRCVPFSPSRAQVHIGAAVGLVNLDGCPIESASGMSPYEGGVVYDVFVVVGGRGYGFLLSGAVDRAYLDAILATVEFQPDAATGG
jgi:hypothetical protein